MNRREFLQAVGGTAYAGGMAALIENEALASATGVTKGVTMTDPNDAAEVFHRCDRWLTEHGPVRPHAELAELVRETAPDQKRDHYGRGDLIEEFEAEVARLLGKEAALFFISGTMAQQIGLRVWSERKGRAIVAMHPLCHPLLYEAQAMPLLHGLRPTPLGETHRLLTLGDLKSYEHVSEPLLALFLELPQRELGGQLPPWDELKAQTDWARGRGAVAHLDGARLWESAPFYRRSYAEIAGLFDTVYVSMYKGMGGIAGCCLAGPKDVIGEARMWRLRHGGRLVHMYPYVLSARLKLRQQLPRFLHYHERAKQIAKVLSAVPGVTVKPDPPQAHMMFVYLKGDRGRMEDAALEIARRDGLRLFETLGGTELPGHWKFEIQVGDGADAVPDAEIKRHFERIVAA